MINIPMDASNFPIDYRLTIVKVYLDTFLPFLNVKNKASSRSSLVIDHTSKKVLILRNTFTSFLLSDFY